MCANNRTHYGPMAIFVCWLHFTQSHYYIIIMQTYLKVINFWNTCQVYSAECVSKIKSILSIILHALYGAVCIQLTHFSYCDCVNMCNLSYPHQIGSMTHLPLFRVMSWNNGIRCMSFYSINNNNDNNNDNTNGNNDNNTNNNNNDYNDDKSHYIKFADAVV